MSSRSNVWTKVAYLLKDAMPSLLDCFSNPDDALVVIKESELSLSSELLTSLGNSYRSNANKVKENFSYILTMIEWLVLAGRMLDARDFIEKTIEENIKTAVDIGALVKMFIQLCPKVEVNARDEFCKHVLFPLSTTLESTKFSKTFALILFDFAISILDLISIEAPQCTLRLLEKQEFYQWNNLGPQCSHLVRSCAAYDVIGNVKHFSDLRHLEEILNFIVERSQTYPNISQAAHCEIFKAIIRWLGPAKSIQKKLWCSHVYDIGRCMVELIDQRQVTVDTCSELIEALHRIITKRRTEDDNEDEMTNSLKTFCNVGIFTYVPI